MFHQYYLQVSKMFVCLQLKDTFHILHILWKLQEIKHGYYFAQVSSST